MSEKWHCEGVGSLLRPPELIEARRRHAAGELTAAEFKHVEDAAAESAIAVQLDAGLDVIGDGEMRRASWMSPFADAFDGFDRTTGVVMPWRDESGQRLETPGRRPVVVDRLRRRHSPATLEEWVFLRARAALGGRPPRPAKITIPGAEMAAAMYDDRLSRDAYPTREDYHAHVVELLRSEVSELVRLGCRYIQLDSPQYGALTDPVNRELFRGSGSDPDRLIDAGIEMDNAIIDGFPGVTFGLHICRGNAMSRFYAAGGYEPVARIFTRGRFGRFLLEYDDGRSGGFEPLRHVPDDRVVVLGLVTTKKPVLEDAAAVRARVEEAARFVSLDRLALSPQCGFASVAAGNRIDPAGQAAKLSLVCGVARDIWP
jgi:5-methyltetrahydropteroyltriglutamate--homocysteine methyltransferase